MKYFRILLSFLLICTIVAVSYISYNYYTAPKQRVPYLSKSNNIDTLNIAFIGDSWAVFHNNHNCIIRNLLADSIHRPIAVYTMGVCGQTSKEIYKSIFDNPYYRQFFQQRKYDFCIVSAGINDTYKKMSISYYSKSMDGIISFLIANKIRPIVLEIPDYNIEDTYKHQTFFRRMLRQVSMFINGTPMDCKQLFRNALDDLVKHNSYEDKLYIVRYKSWNNNYIYDINKLYRYDGMHLNANGYTVLDSTFAKIIIDDLKK